MFRTITRLLTIGLALTAATATAQPPSPPPPISAPPLPDLSDLGRKPTATSSTGWVGITMMQPTPKLARAAGLPKLTGAMVTGVFPGSAAEKAGIGLGDLLLAVHGTTVKTTADVVKVLQARAPGERVELTLFSKGGQRTVPVTLGERQADLESVTFQLARDGHAWAQYQAGRIAYTRAEKTGDFSEALELFRKSAEQGDMQGQYMTGNMLMNGKGGRDDVEAVKWMRMAAEQDYLPAFNDLGRMLALGRGVEKNEAKAVELFRYAAAYDHPLALHNLGVSHDQGMGVPRDRAAAVQWFQKAADLGYVRSQASLGKMYMKGDGVEQNDEFAASYLRKAADQGDSNSQCDLGFLYHTGRGVEKSFGEAMKWYLAAARQGNGTAQCNIGILYLNGQGVEKNRKEAIFWFLKATKGGNIAAREQLKIMGLEV
jgi:TPR repeat protein